MLVEDVGEYFFARHETVAAASGHECAPVKAVLRAVNVHGVAALHLCNLPLDDEIERRRGGPGFNDDLLRLKVGNIHRSAYQRLFCGREAVKGRNRKIESVGHGVHVVISALLLYRYFRVIPIIDNPWVRPERSAVVS